MLEELQLEQPWHGKYITKIFTGCHDPIAEYMEKLCSGNGGLCVCRKDHISHHNLFPLSSSFLIKHDEGDQSLDQLLGWIHWKSEFT